MRRAALVTTLALLTVPVGASAQTPLPGSPTFTIETINLKSIRLDPSTYTRIQYTRAGTKPNGYRTANNSSFTGATWLSFTEGTTTSTVQGSTTWITGTATVPTVDGSGACGAGTIKIKRYFQFRGTNKLLKTITSNIVSDSLCVPFG